MKKNNIDKSIEWNRVNKERRKEISDKYRNLHKKQIAEKYHLNRESILAKQKEYYRANAEYIKSRERLKRYGINTRQFNDMLKTQNNLCAICLQPETQIQHGKLRPLCVDHNHKTGEIRALLCNDCNTGLGKFKDDINLLEKSINYLKGFIHE